MTAQERDYEEILGRALHSATDQIEPVGDGLTKIRARLTEPWLKRQWWLLRSEFMVLRWLVIVRCEAFLSTARAGATAADRTASPDAADSPAAAPGSRPRSPRPVLGGITAWAAGKRPHKSVGPAMAWLRPALAVAGAVVLVVAGVFALGGIRGTFVGLENDNPPGHTNSSHGGGPGGPQGAGSSLRGSKTPAQRRSGAGSTGATALHRGATAAPSACSSPSTPPVNSPSPSPSPTSASPSPSPTTASPSPSPTTASPSPSTSSGPMVGYHSQAPIRTTALMECGPTPDASPTNQAGTGS